MISLLLIRTLVGIAVIVSAGITNSLPWQVRPANRSVGLALWGTAVPSSESAESNYDVKSYTIVLRIDPVAKSVSGSVTMTATVTSSRLSTVSLDLADTLTVLTIQSEGRELKFTHDQNRITVELRHRHQRGSRFEVKVNYDGQPKGDGFSFGQHQSIPMISTYGLPFYCTTVVAM